VTADLLKSLTVSECLVRSFSHAQRQSLSDASGYDSSFCSVHRDCVIIMQRIQHRTSGLRFPFAKFVASMQIPDDTNV